MPHTILDLVAARSVVLLWLYDNLFKPPLVRAAVYFVEEEFPFVFLAAFALRSIPVSGPERPPTWRSRKAMIVYAAIGSATAVMRLAAEIYFRRTPW